MARNTAREIDIEAATWVARVDRGLDDTEAASLDTWLAEDIRHQGAFARAQAVDLYAERARAFGSGFDPADFAPEEPDSGGSMAGRRRALALGFGAIAAGLVASAVGYTVMAPAARDHTDDHPGERIVAHKGEMQVVALADGSVVTLSTDTEVLVRYSPQARMIDLVRGQALFAVAKDPQRPFLVRAAGTETRAIGTKFSVSDIGGAPVKVVVQEGVVQVRNRGGKAVAPVRLAANMRASIEPGGGAIRVETPSAGEIEREFAWRDGNIVLEGETLREAVAQFARYSDTRIVFDDPGIGDEAVAGLFRANDPVGFAEAVATSFGLHAEVRAGEVRLRR